MEILSEQTPANEGLNDQFEVLNSIVLEKNVDRIISLNDNDCFLAASYHLKDGVKTGDLNELTIENGQIRVAKKLAEFDFGVLSLAKDGDVLSCGGSDGKVILFKIENDSISGTIEY